MITYCLYLLQRISLIFPWSLVNLRNVIGFK
uniref:Uncharacterized protein n=1 Tax=Rhizophora mucronata TaxID=61149 RepID=A0A2P2PBY3_RHIMU